MKKARCCFSFEVYESAEDLPAEEKTLLNKAREAVHTAYAPYSGFKVGAAALLANGEIITGANQENASFPAGLCAERVVLAMAGATRPGMAIRKLAISYRPSSGAADRPIAPCGICRQSLQEFSQRTGSAISLTLAGMERKAYIVPDAADLMPLAFTQDAL